MTLSGFSGTSKYLDLQKLPSNMIPQSIFINNGESLAQITKKIESNNLKYPLIAKPDLGRTGRDIMKINNPHDLSIYLGLINENFLIQEFINYPLEFGVFYYRLPNEKTGHISGITEKCFMFIIGDGKKKFGSLLTNHPRAKFYYKDLKNKYKDHRDNIVPKGEKIQLNYIGNHVRGSTFYDKSHLNDKILEKVFDDLSKNIGEFYFGRYDIKVQNIKDLYTGNFKIIEVNGIGSLPVHNLDPNYGAIRAYKEIFHHRNLVYQISKQNLANGHPHLTIKKGFQIIKKYGI